MYEEILFTFLDQAGEIGQFSRAHLVISYGLLIYHGTEVGTHTGIVQHLIGYLLALGNIKITREQTDAGYTDFKLTRYIRIFKTFFIKIPLLLQVFPAKF